MVRRVGWVAAQAAFLAGLLNGFVVAVADRRWILAVLFAYMTANVVWSLNWLPGGPGRLRRFLRRKRLGAEHPGQ